ncbi:MAG: hypothetical protein RI900_854 [Actinomycetota bacterium]|jgi:L-asparaginase
MTVHVIATGGTISSHWDGREWTNLDGASLMAELGALPVDVRVTDAAAGPSANLSTDDMWRIAGRVRSALDDGAEGVVVVHGTDTMDLTAFTTQLLLGTDADRAPVVFTGSMRPHSHPAPDGPGNLRDAVTVAAGSEARGRDVLMCMDGRLHSARHVRKVNAASVDAFDSFPSEPVGSVSGGTMTISGADAPTPSSPGLRGPVPLVLAYPGMEPPTLSTALDGAAGAVVQGFGDLNVPNALWPVIGAAAAQGTVVLLASGAYTPNRGDELRAFGAFGAAGLPPQKARLALMAGLALHDDPSDVIAFVHRFAITRDFHDRSTD